MLLGFGRLGGWKSWTVGPCDYNLIQMDDYPADSCAMYRTAFLLNFNQVINKSCPGNRLTCHILSKRPGKA